MPAREEILNDVRNLLDHLPDVHCRADGENSSREIDPLKLEGLTGRIRSWTPGDNEAVANPIEHLQLALDYIMRGPPKPGLSLNELADRSNLRDPLTLTLLALAYIRCALSYVYDSGGGGFILSPDKEDDAQELGYGIDLFTIHEATDLLLEVEEYLQRRPSDPRLSLVSACLELIERCPIACLEEVQAVDEGDISRVGFDRDNPAVLVLQEWR